VRSSRDVRGKPCRSKMRRIAIKFREIVNEIRQNPQVSNSQGFGNDNQRKYQKKAGKKVAFPL
jgi:hypothetical protein